MDNETIELVARIIAPSRWTVFDAHLASVKRKYKGQNIAWPEDQFQDKQSMSLAKAVLTALTASGWQRVPEGHVVVPVEQLQRIRTSMVTLQQNSQGCAANHYAHDFEVHGMPGWLIDTRADLDRLTAMAGTKEDV
jgi:hypothetical protein